MLDRVKHRVREALLEVVDEGVRHHTSDLEGQIASLKRQLELFEIRDRRDLFAAAERQAVLESAEYAGRNFSGTRHFWHPHETLKYALAEAPSGGMALEFGVFSGTTLRIIADARDREQVFGFDVFSGLPHDWRPGFPAGTFAVDQRPYVPGATLVVGLFADTLSGFLDEHGGHIDFLHVDCDLYDAAVTVLDGVGSRLRRGSVVVFDEYFNHQNWQEGEFKAWAEFVERVGVGYEYIAYTADHEQVAVRITDI